MSNRLRRIPAARRAGIGGAGPQMLSSVELTSADLGRHAEKDELNLAILGSPVTPLGQAVRRAQRYFTDEEIVAAMAGTSDTVALTIVDLEPAFVNAAMIAAIISDENDPA